jgi:protoporphyrin/coproporphyrin ferrochelatase
MAAYDALLVVSFGGPEGRDDVLPFLRNVTAGRGIPDERLAAVAEHYYRFGGVSPINQQCRDLIQAVEKELAAAGDGLPVYWGNRNWAPYLADTVAAMAAAGVRRALAFATSAYSSWSSCRQYLDDIDRARERVGAAAPVIDKITPYYAEPGFARAFADATAAAIATLPAEVAGHADLVFTAHSIPRSMADRSGPHQGGPHHGGPDGGAYPAQLAVVAERVVGLLAERGVPVARPWRLAWSSRSGPPSQPWLEPDISDCLEELAVAGSRAVVVIPAGFVSDHMEVRYDLDVEAADTAARLGLPFARAATPGISAPFVTMITDLIRRCQADPGRADAGGVRGRAPGDGGGLCGIGCCTPAPRPAASGRQAAR